MQHQLTSPLILVQGVELGGFESRLCAKLGCMGLRMRLFDPGVLLPPPSLPADWIFVMWLDAVTYLHHHGPSDPDMEVPWYRGEEWNYMRGGLSTIDRDYGIFNKVGVGGLGGGDREGRWLLLLISRAAGGRKE